MMLAEIDGEIARLMPPLSPFLYAEAQLSSVKSLLDTFARLIALKSYEEATLIIKGLHYNSTQADVYALRYNCALDDAARHVEKLKDELTLESVTT